MAAPDVVKKYKRLAGLVDDVLRKASLLRDLDAGYCSGDNYHDAERELFAAVDALREATK